MQPPRTLLLLVLTATIPLTAFAQEYTKTYQVFQNSDGMLFVSEPVVGKTLGSPLGPTTCSLLDCQKWIAANWTDMRPTGLKSRMDADSLSITDTKLSIIVNAEQQYTLKLASDKTPRGWKDVGKTCTLGDCMTYIKGVWTDMRPLSQRR